MGRSKASSLRRAMLHEQAIRAYEALASGQSDPRYHAVRIAAGVERDDIATAASSVRVVRTRRLLKVDHRIIQSRIDAASRAVSLETFTHHKLASVKGVHVWTRVNPDAVKAGKRQAALMAARAKRQTAIARIAATQPSAQGKAGRLTSVRTVNIADMAGETWATKGK